VALSALSGEGVDALIRTLADRLTQGHRRYALTLDTADGAGAAWLHQHGEVTAHTIDESGAHYDVRLSPSDYRRFLERGGAQQDFNRD
jgi:GTP-binding protein HflX